MLGHRIHRLPRLSHVSRRHFADNAPQYPFKKLRAFPFEMSPSEAIVQMGPHASAFSMFEGIIGSLGARYFPEFGFTPFTPTHITPVYFPAWIIDAEVEATVSLTDESKQRAITSQFRGAYLPGSDYKVLSSVSLWPKDLSSRLDSAIPFTKDLEHQHGTDVACLPYTISPFAVLDTVRSLSYAEATVHRALRFNPTSVKPTLFAAYPVLIPLYLAHYEALEKSLSRSFFIEGYSKSGRIMTDRFELHETLQALHRFLQYPVNVLRGLPTPFAQMKTLGMEVLPSTTMWLDSVMNTPQATERLASHSSVDSDEDLRIREFTREELGDVRKWMDQGPEIANLKLFLKLSGNATVLGAAPNGERSKEIMLQSLKTKLQDLEEKRQEDKPRWWKEWEPALDSDKTST